MFKKRKQTTLGIKFQKKRKIAVLVTTVVMLVGIGLNPMLVIFGEINASSESQKVRATKLDYEDSTEEQDEEVKETDEEVKETIEEATVESELTEEKEVIEKQEIVEEQKEVTVEFESSKEQVAKVDTATFQGRWGGSIFRFDYITGVLTIKEGKLDLSSNAPWLIYQSNDITPSKIKKIVLEGQVVAPNDSSSLFADLYNLTGIINLEKLDTSNVTDMKLMFYRCFDLKSINLSRFDTSNVTNMYAMLSTCINLESIDLSGFDTSNVKDMDQMFFDCYKLKSLDLSGFNTSNVVNMSSMFKNCLVLESLNLSGFNTSKVVTMIGMLKGVTIKKLILGDNFKFTKMIFFTADLGAPKEMNTGDALTGNWIREDGKSSGYSPADFMEKYGTEELTAGAYVAEIKQLIFKEVPLNLSFNESKISSKTLEIQRKEVEWKIVVKDTREYKTNWRVTAKLKKPFKTVNGDLLENILQYRKENIDDQEIGTTDAVNVFDGGATTTTTTTSLTDVKWNEGEGPYLKVAPGTAKIGRYECEIQWALIDAPI